MSTQYTSGRLETIAENTLHTAITAQQYNLRLCFFYSKTGFWPSSAKSQPIWIKFYTHLLLYRIHLWVDLDLDRLLGGSRPNQNVYVFSVILVTHPKSYTETTNRRDFSGKPLKWRWGRVLSWSEPDPNNSIFRILGYPSTILRTAHTKQFYPKPMVPMESRDSDRFNLSLVRRVCDQAFCRYRPMKGAVVVT